MRSKSNQPHGNRLNSAYLTQQHFRQALIAGLIVHVALLITYAFYIEADSIKIPEKPLMIRFGSEQAANLSADKKDSKAPTPREKPALSAPAAQPMPPLPVPRSLQEPVKVKPTPQHQQPMPLAPQAVPDKPQEAAKKAPLTPRPTERLEPSELPPLVQEFTPTPQESDPNALNTATPEIPFVQHLASDSAPVQGLQGHVLGSRSAEENQALTRYEQTLSLWLRRHRIYPAQARKDNIEGQGVLRLQIDRMGNIRYYEVAESTGHPILDEAIEQIARRANPVPPYPDELSTQPVEEFLINMNFSLQ